MLVDVNKTSNDRHLPMPNSHDVLSIDSRMSKATNSVNYITPATNQSIIDGAKNGQFTIVQSSYITLPLSNLLVGMNSGINGSTTLLYTAPHNLPYTPGIIAYWFDSSNKRYINMPYTFYGIVSTTGLNITYRAAIDATNLYIYADVMTLNETTNISGNSFRFYLTQQTPN